MNFTAKSEKGMDFYKRIAIACRMIPQGCVATYGQIAALCGKPKNARQVGYALKTGQAGENIPAHRIVGASGKLVGAAYFKTPTAQMKMLAAEGVAVQLRDGCQCVSIKAYGWRPDDGAYDALDAAFSLAEQENIQ